MRLLQEQIDQEARLSLNLIQEKSAHLEPLREELETWREKYEKSQSLVKLRRKTTALFQEYSWAVVIRMEKDIEKARSEKLTLVKMREKHEAKMAEEEGKLRETSRAYDDTKKEINETTKKAAECQARQEQVQTELAQATREYKAIQSEVKSVQTQIDRKTKDKRELVEQCQRERANRESGLNDSTDVQRQKDAAIEQLTTELSRLGERESSLSQELTTLTERLESASEKRGQVRVEKISTEKTIKSQESALLNLKSSMTSQIQKFGYFMGALVSDINRAHEAGRFKQKPRGPIGMFIEPKDVQWSLAIERCLGGLMTSFICGSFEDERVLTSLFAQHIKQKYLRPRIIVTDFDQPLYDVRRYVS